MLFFLKSSTNEQKVVYGRITVDGIPKEFSTKHKWWENRWDTNTSRPIGNKIDAATLTQHLDALELRVKLERAKLIERGQEISAYKLKLAALGIDPNDHLLKQEYNHFVHKMQKLVDSGEYVPGTVSNFKTTLKHTLEFIQERYGFDDISISKIKYQFISELEFWYKTTKKIKHNTAVKHLSNLKQVIQECVKAGKLEKDPFYKYKLGRKEVIIEPLEQIEIEIIWNKQFNSERLLLVRDIFIFSCFTGMAYADIKKLNIEQIHTDSNGTEWISSNRQKTKTGFRIPLFPIAKEIIKKYKNHPKCIGTKKVLPIYSNQKMNEYLKEIAEICGITKKLTFHLARHTFATTVTLNNGVPLETVSKILGHRTIKQTQHYAKIKDSKLVEDLTKVEDRFMLASQGSKISNDTTNLCVDFDFSYIVNIHIRLSDEELDLISLAINNCECSYDSQPGGFWYNIIKNKSNRNGFINEISISISELDRTVLKSLELYCQLPNNNFSGKAIELNKQLSYILKISIEQKIKLNKSSELTSSKEQIPRIV